MSSTTDTPDQEIIQGDCIDEMQAMDENSVHAVVTDPPYGLAFMGRTWDQFEPKEYQDWCEQWAIEALRVLKPGGHLIAFSGNRTHHRLFSAVEDAGFEIRDTLTYHYGTGFPKGSDVGKHIDRYYDAEDEREVVGEYQPPNGKEWNLENDESVPGDDGKTLGGGPMHQRSKAMEVTAPATSAAEQWDGWRSQLKPATEFAVLARAPMSESAVYRNVLEHGTGALNIDRTRIPTDESLKGGAHCEDSNRSTLSGDDRDRAGRGMFDPENHEPTEYNEDQGRYPANLLLDGVAARMLDSQTSDLGSPWGDATRGSGRELYGSYDDDEWDGTQEIAQYGDEGGASRFFYTAKASKSERTIDGQIDNDHPTVKPLDLMEWLVALVTAPGQRVLDPFAGSGTTIMACKRLGREGIGIEKDAEHADLARKRVELAHELETDFTESGSFPEKHREAPSFNEWLESRDEDDDTDGPATLESFADADDD